MRKCHSEQQTTRCGGVDDKSRRLNLKSLPYLERQVAKIKLWNRNNTWKKNQSRLPHVSCVPSENGKGVKPKYHWHDEYKVVSLIFFFFCICVDSTECCIALESSANSSQYPKMEGNLWGELMLKAVGWKIPFNQLDQSRGYPYVHLYCSMKSNKIKS